MLVAKCCGAVNKYDVCVIGSSKLIQRINKIIFRLMKDLLMASTAAVLCHKVRPRTEVNMAALMVLAQALGMMGRCKLFNKKSKTGLSNDAPPEI